MRATRDQVFQALFDLLVAADFPFDLVTQSRDMEHWDNVVSARQPALFLQQGPQEADQQQAMALNHWLLQCTCWIYYRRSQTTPASYNVTVIDEVQDAIDNIISPLPGFRQTLGNLVTNVRVKTFGDQEAVLDQLGGQCLVWAEIEILTFDRQGPVR